MRKILYNIIAKSKKAIFEWDYQPDQSNNLDYNYYWSFPMPGDDVVHPSGDPHPTSYEPLDKVVNRDDYPQESGGQGELDTVDYWTDTGTHYYILEPMLDNDADDVNFGFDYGFYKDYLDV